MKHLRFLLMAALVAMPLTACDEDTNPTEVVAYGTVTGTVSAEGTGLSGVGVTLVGATTQSATTGSGGTYTFTNVPAGSYGVSIDASSQSDVSFSQTSKATTISSSGETATVDFSGSYIRTATITGVVSASGTPLGGVAVAVTGGPDNVTNNSVTNAGGEYFATGLRAGTYTVTITAPAGVDFTTTSAQVTVGTGETKTAHFPGAAVQLATISGAVTVDNVGTAGIAVALSGDAVAETETGPGGAFAFTNLTPGSYTVTITPPADVTFTVTSKSVTVGAGETGVVNFAGVGPQEPATVSIQSIMKGGAVVDLTNVYGQIEITLNIERNDQELDYVDVLIGDVVVATQDFANAAAPAEAVGEAEVVTLNVPTTQVMMGTNDLWTPAVNNGGNEISANLYVVEGDQPIPTNKVPVVMQNYDAMLPGMAFGGDLLFAPDEPDRTATDDDGDVWYAGSATFTGPIFLSYTTKTPDDVDFYSSGCGWSDSQSIVGDYMTGITISNTYDCENIEYDGVEPLWWDFDVDYDDYVGPDGTAVMFGSCDEEDYTMSAIGAEFYLSDGTVGPRRFVISCPVEGQIEDSNDLNMDNKAPTVSLDLPVAFNDNFSEYWVKGDYDFVDEDVLSSDGGVGGIVEKTFLWNWEYTYPEGWELGDDCTTTEVTTPEDTPLDETLTSDDADTGESYAICGYAEDALGNGAYTAVSNSFGVDMVAPQARIWGDDDSDDPGFTAPLGTAGPDSLGTAISEDLDMTVFGMAGMTGTGDYHYDVMDVMHWGLDAIDDRSGLDDYTGFPFIQTIIRVGAATPADTVIGADGMALTPLSDNWRRVDAETPFLAGITDPGIFTYEGYAIDRAGNMSEVFFYNWLVDIYEAPMTTAITPVSTSYAVGAPAMFNVWGSDDLEIMELGFHMTYPTTNGDVAFYYGGQPVAADRWDMTFMDMLSGAQYGTSTVWGRIDFTDTDGAVPGALVYLADTLALPTDVTVELTEDAGYNPGDGSTATWDFITYDLDGWGETYIEAPWPDENIDFFTISDSGTNYVVEHIGGSSVDAFILDEVWLVAFGPAEPYELVVCAMTDGSNNVYTDNGINRFYTYSFAYPTTGMCADPPEGYSIRAVGVKGDALLVTDEEEIVPNPPPAT